MSETTRNLKKHRPSYLYKSGFEQLEMMESCRNVMEEVRDELRKLNALLSCARFQNIPNVLRRISRNTAKPRRKRESGASAA
jgi:hypothetical protein